MEGLGSSPGAPRRAGKNGQCPPAAASLAGIDVSFGSYSSVFFLGRFSRDVDGDETEACVFGTRR